MHRRTTAALASVPVAALAALALGGGAGASEVHAATATRTLSADPNGDLAFTKHRLTVRHGVVKLVMTNPSSSGLEHGIAIAVRGPDKRGSVVEPGGTSRVRARLKPGRYTFYCPVPGHRTAGMKGRLIVK
jgi:uncharacterized cupredoxin-like copper-binding protein